MAGLTGQVPRDDRAWPRGASALSLVFVCGALVTVAALAATARTEVLAGVVVAAFLLSAVCMGLLYGAAMRGWVRGEPHSARRQAPMVAVTLVGVGLLVVDGRLGGAVLGLAAAGMFLANLLAIRGARANREVVDAPEAAREPPDSTESPATGRGAGGTDPVVGGEADRTPVGRVLREQVAVESRRAGAWLVAGAVAAMGCLVLGAPAAVTITVALLAAVSLAWVVRRLVGSWLARRDFESALHPPRRAYVVLLHDPAPRMIRPLLAVWPDVPEPRGGRLPRAEAVFRADDELQDLMCFQGEIVVHEAWVDTGRRSWSKPRWVAADAGVALPHRRALLGRWYVGALVGGERPDPPRSLTIALPRSDEEVTVELGSVGSAWPAAVGGRLLGLVVIGLLVWWLG